MRDWRDKNKMLPFVLLLVLLVPIGSARADSASLESPGLPKTLYVVPFLNVMIPAPVSSVFFDAFIDDMIAAGAPAGMSIRILKQELDAIDREWLGRQHFVTGELFGYIEESGCCSTEIEAKARLYLYRPGSAEPVAEIVVPGDTFFDHDLSTLAQERRLLAGRMAGELAGELMRHLAGSR